MRASFAPILALLAGCGALAAPAAPVEVAPPAPLAARQAPANPATPPTEAEPPSTAEVTIDLAGSASAFIPAVALGAGVDGHSFGDSGAIYRPATLRAMRAVGLQPLSYRLRTELAIQAWHWNARGRWSDARHARGYWISDDRLGAPINVSFGYRLPRRGNTIDQAENDGYSRLVDGSLKTFWKSNPYLDRRYTGEDNGRHPQWLIADLGESVPVDAIRIVWGTPYATRYRVQYWDGQGPDDPDEYPEGRWQTFPGGVIARGEGGDVALRLGTEPVPARFLRVLLEEPSRLAPPGAKDPRDALGYAVREVFIGTLDAAGRLRDKVRHGPGRAVQSRFFVSSTDPWHRASDLDPGVEQPGIDRVFASGLTRGLPVLMPVGVLYDTPDNAASLLRYLRRRGYLLRGVELGEEPDGQYAAPEDYGALYLQAADALRAVDPAIGLGGPSFQSLWDEPMMAWSGTPVAPDRPWLARFLAYLQARGRIADLGFLSFEWYPFDEICEPVAPQLRRGPALLADALAELRAQGLSSKVPLLMTEYGYSAFSAQAEVDLPGALFNADAVGTFLALGGATAYLYGYEPSPIYRGPGCDTWGNNALFLSDERRRIVARTATYRAAALLARQWAGNPARLHRVYPTRIEGVGGEMSPLSAYAVKRPDGQWAVLLINKDPEREWRVGMRFALADSSAAVPWSGPAELYQFSARQYRWRASGARGRPARNRPPAHALLPDRDPVTVRLPAWSLTVVRGRGPELSARALGALPKWPATGSPAAN